MTENSKTNQLDDNDNDDDDNDDDDKLLEKILTYLITGFIKIQMTENSKTSVPFVVDGRKWFIHFNF